MDRIASLENTLKNGGGITVPHSAHPSPPVKMEAEDLPPWEEAPPPDAAPPGEPVSQEAGVSPAPEAASVSGDVLRTAFLAGMSPNVSALVGLWKHRFEGGRFSFLVPAKFKSMLPRLSDTQENCGKLAAEKFPGVQFSFEPEGAQPPPANQFLNVVEELFGKDYVDEDSPAPNS